MSLMSIIICFRYTVKELLQLEFFAEETGIRVDIVKTSTSAMDEVPADVIQLQLRVIDSKKRRLQQRENEAVQFDYNISTDNPNDVAQEMVRQNLLSVYCCCQTILSIMYHHHHHQRISSRCKSSKNFRAAM